MEQIIYFEVKWQEDKSIPMSIKYTKFEEAKEQFNRWKNYPTCNFAVLSSWGTRYTSITSMIDVLDVIDSYNREY